MKNDAQWAAQESADALKDVQKALVSRANQMADMAEKLKRRASEIGEPCSLGTTASDRAGWAVNEIENLLRNLNFAEMTRLIANLSLAQYKAGQCK